MESSARTPVLSDLPGVYRVCHETALTAGGRRMRLGDPDLVGHLYAGPYVVGAPQWSEVVVDDAGIAGYLLSAPDTAAFSAWAEESWWPRLREQYPLAAARRREGDWPDDAALIRSLHSPGSPPGELADDYPAHFHIDLLPRLQGQGWGRRLIERMLARLRAAGVAGVHMGVVADNAGAIGFYEHLGFVVLSSDADTCWMGMDLRPQAA